MSRKYTPDPDWWARRASSPEYQNAYDNISSKIKFSPDDVMIDVACGTGEIIRRMPLHAKIIGTDNNTIMLNKALENLKSYEIPVKVYTEPISPERWDEELKESRVTLIKDDMYKSSLPSSICDIAVHTFPEYITQEKLSALSEIDRTKSVSKMADTRDKEIHRLLKPNGIYYSAVYDALARRKDYFKAQRKHLRKSDIRGLFKLASAELVRDEKIAEDGFSEKPKGLGRNPSYGYGIIKLRKTI